MTSDDDTTSRLLSRRKGFVHEREPPLFSDLTEHDKARAPPTLRRRKRTRQSHSYRRASRSRSSSSKPTRRSSRCSEARSFAPTRRCGVTSCGGFAENVTDWEFDEFRSSTRRRLSWRG